MSEQASSFQKTSDRRERLHVINKKNAIIKGILKHDYSSELATNVT